MRRIITAISVPILLVGGGAVVVTALAAGEGRAPAQLVTPAAVTAIEGPVDGPLSGGARLTLSGVNLHAVRVEVGGVSAPIQVAADGTAAVTVPAASTPGGPVPIEVFEGRRAVPTADVTFEYRVTSPVDRQLAYAIAHWDEYNLAEFGDFNPWGGDCQNFVSQTLVARGWVPNGEWFNVAQQDWAPAFVHVPSFDEYLRAHPELGAVEVPIDERTAVKLGDLVVFDWDDDGSLDHIEVVARIEPRPDGGFAIATLGHSDVNSWYRDLDRAITVEHPGASASFWSIP